MLAAIFALAIAGASTGSNPKGAAETCVAAVGGRDGSRLLITVTRGADGAILDRYVTMVPPMLKSEVVDTRLKLENPYISIDYAYPVAGRFSAPIRVWVSAQSAVHSGKLDDTRVSLAFDGQAHDTAPLQLVSPQFTDSRRAEWEAGDPLIKTLDEARTTDIVLTSQNGRRMASTRYDLAYEILRDRMFSVLAPRIENPAAWQRNCVGVVSRR